MEQEAYKLLMGKISVGLNPLFKAAEAYYNKSEVYFKHGTFSSFRHNVNQATFERKCDHVLRFLEDYLPTVNNAINLTISGFFENNQNLFRNLNNHSFFNLCQIEYGRGDQILIPKSDDPTFFYDNIRKSRFNRIRAQRALQDIFTKYNLLKNRYGNYNIEAAVADPREIQYPYQLLMDALSYENREERRQQLIEHANTAYKDVLSYSMKCESFELVIDYLERTTLEYNDIYTLYQAQVFKRTFDQISNHDYEDEDILPSLESINSYTILNTNLLHSFYGANQRLKPWVKSVTNYIYKKRNRENLNTSLFQRGSIKGVFDAI